MGLYLHHLCMDLPKPVSNIEGCPDARPGLETKLQTSSSRTPTHNITSHHQYRACQMWTRYFHCRSSYKQVEGFTHGIESCCAAFPHFLLAWRRGETRGCPLCFASISATEENTSKAPRTRLYIRSQLAAKELCERKKSYNSGKKTPRSFL